MLIFALFAVVQVVSFRIVKRSNEGEDRNLETGSKSQLYTDDLESLENGVNNKFDMDPDEQYNAQDQLSGEEEESLADDATGDESEMDFDWEDDETQLKDAEESLVDDDLMAGRRRRDSRSRSGRSRDDRSRDSGRSRGSPEHKGPRRRSVSGDFRRRSTKGYYSDFTSDAGWMVLDDCGHSHNENGESAVKYTNRAVKWASSPGEGAVIEVKAEKSSKPDKDCRRRRDSGAYTYQISANLRWKQPSFYGTTTLTAKFFPEGGNSSSVCYIDSMGWDGAQQNSPSCWFNVHGCKDSDKGCQTSISSACYNCRKCGTSNNRVDDIKIPGNLREKNKFQLVFHKDDVRILVNDQEVLRRTPDSTGQFNLPHEPMSPRVHCRSQHVQNIEKTTTATLYEWKWEPQSSYDLQMLNASVS